MKKRPCVLSETPLRLDWNALAFGDKLFGRKFEGDWSGGDILIDEGKFLEFEKWTNM